MNKIIHQEFLAPQTKKIILSAKDVAQKARAGQFVVIVVDEKGERIPLTIVDSDAKGGTITLIVQGAGKSTCKMLKLEVDDEMLHVLGPLGKPTEISNLGTVVTVGGGVMEGAGVAVGVGTAFSKLQSHLSE